MILNKNFVENMEHQILVIWFDQVSVAVVYFNDRCH